LGALRLFCACQELAGKLVTPFVVFDLKVSHARFKPQKARQLLNVRRRGLPAPLHVKDSPFAGVLDLDASTVAG
jgi:hypothetical protein